MRKIITLLIFLISLTSSLVYSQDQKIVLDELIQKAIQLSPRLRMLRNKQNISEARIPQLSNLPDPMLTFGAMNLPVNSFSFSEEPMTGKIIGLSQAMPFPGKLNAAEKVQRKNIEINQQEIDDAANEIINDITKTYYDLSYAREAIIIAEKSKNILTNIADVVRTKYAVSKASQQNLIQVEVELTKIKDKIEELRGKERASLAVLNSYLLRDINTPVRTSEVLLLPSQSFGISVLDSLAKEYRPYLKGIEIAKEKSRLMEDLAGYEFYPNFNFTVQYSQRDEITKTNTPLNDFVSFMIGINLPLDYGGKKSAKVEEAKLMQKMYSDQYETAVQFLNKKFGVSIAKLNEQKEREKLIREGLLPQAEQSLKAALASYQVGDIDFINVLDAQNKIFEIEIKLLGIRTKYFKEVSELEFLIGQKVYNN